MVFLSKSLFRFGAVSLKLRRFLLELLVFVFEHRLTILESDISLVITCKQFELIIILPVVGKHVIHLINFFLLLKLLLLTIRRVLLLEVWLWIRLLLLEVWLWKRLLLLEVWLGIRLLLLLVVRVLVLDGVAVLVELLDWCLQDLRSWHHWLIHDALAHSLLLFLLVVDVHIASHTALVEGICELIAVFSFNFFSLQLFQVIFLVVEYIVDFFFCYLFVVSFNEILQRTSLVRFIKLSHSWVVSICHASTWERYSICYSLKYTSYLD